VSHKIDENNEKAKIVQLFKREAKNKKEFKHVIDLGYKSDSKAFQF